MHYLLHPGSAWGELPLGDGWLAHTNLRGEWYEGGGGEAAAAAFPQGRVGLGRLPGRVSPVPRGGVGWGGSHLCQSFHRCLVGLIIDGGAEVGEVRLALSLGGGVHLFQGAGPVQRPTSQYLRHRFPFPLPPSLHCCLQTRQTFHLFYS